MVIVDKEPKPIRVRHKDPFAGYTNAGPAPKLDPPYHFSGGSWIEIRGIPMMEEAIYAPGVPTPTGRIYRPLAQPRAHEAVAWDDADITFFRALAERNPSIWELEPTLVEKVKAVGRRRIKAEAET
jgi:hypothetical protein